MTIYSIIDGNHEPQTFEGFQHYKPGVPGILCVTTFDGEQDLWLLDDLRAVEELLRYFRMSWGREPQHTETYQFMGSRG